MKTFRLKDQRTGEIIEVNLIGNLPKQAVTIGPLTLSLADFSTMVDKVMCGGDLGDETDPRRGLQKIVSDYQIGEGRTIGSQRFRPDRHRLMAGTASGL